MALGISARRVVLDVSSFQGNVDFAQIKAASPEVIGVIIKACEGQWSGSNPNFEEQYASARAAGLLTGFYCFDHTSVDATLQAQIYLAKVAGKTAELGHWLDFEANDAQGSATQVVLHISNWLRAVSAARSETIGVYTAPWAWNQWTGGADFSSYPLWLAGYTPSLPPSPAHWGQPKLWQFTDSYPTYLGDVDASVILDDSWPQEADLTPAQDALLTTIGKAVYQLGGVVTQIGTAVAQMHQDMNTEAGLLAGRGDPTHYGLLQVQADLAELKTALATVPGGAVDPAPIADAVASQVKQITWRAS